MWAKKRGSTSGTGSVPALPRGSLRPHRRWLPTCALLVPCGSPPTPSTAGAGPFFAPPSDGGGAPALPGLPPAASESLRGDTSLVAGLFSRCASQARATREPPRAGVPAPTAQRVPAGSGVAGRRGKGVRKRGSEAEKGVEN